MEIDITAEDGAYVVVVSTNRGRARAGFSRSFSSEYRALEPDVDLLAAVAKVTGGISAATPEQLLSEPIAPLRVPSPLYRYLLAMAALLLLFDVGLRRVQSLREIIPFLPA